MGFVTFLWKQPQTPRNFYNPQRCTMMNVSWLLFAIVWCMFLIPTTSFDHLLCIFIILLIMLVCHINTLTVYYKVWNLVSIYICLSVFKFKSVYTCKQTELKFSVNELKRRVHFHHFQLRLMWPWVNLVSSFF